MQDFAFHRGRDDSISISTPPSSYSPATEKFVVSVCRCAVSMSTRCLSCSMTLVKSLSSSNPAMASSVSPIAYSLKHSALAVGDLMVSPLGQQPVKELKEPIFLEESCKDGVVLEGELGASQGLDDLFHGAYRE